jgi:hypothetical protein
MKLGIAGSALVFASFLVQPTGDAPAGERTCSIKDCFYARDVRDFRVIDRNTVIVYVGAQRCAFRLELRGAFCDLTYAPELVFNDPKDLPINEPDQRLQHQMNMTPGSAGSVSFGDVVDSNLPSQRRGRVSVKVCDNNLGLQVSGGAFSDIAIANPTDPRSDPSIPVDRFGRAQTAGCQVSSVSSITDDQVMEIFVARRVTPPPPPMGSGEIQVGKQPDDPRPAPERNQKSE